MTDSSLTSISLDSSGDALERLGPYRVEKLLGKGGMGEVYLAVDERLDRRVAVKRIRPRKAKREYRVRFEREARAVAALDHASIVRVHDVVELPEGWCLIMEYVPGASLDQLSKDGGLAMDRVLEIGRQIALGLAEAHSKGILHRDLKPDNVLVTPKGQVKILDFGLVHQEVPESEDRLTLPGALVGTPDYLAPEQVGGEQDPHSDLFSLGTLLFELASGERPFHGKTMLSTLRKIVTEQAPDLETLRPDAPGEFCALLRELHAKEPEDRPSASDTAARLAEILGRGMPGRVPSSVSLRAPTLRTGDAWDGEESQPLIFIRVADAAAQSFSHPSDALQAAFRWALDDRKSVALHLESEPRDLAEALAGLAGESQVLATGQAFDVLRRAHDQPSDLAWIAHGPYALQGRVEPVEVYEVGVEQRSTLRAPEGKRDSGWLRVVGGETIPGWRPAVSLPIPRREGWRLDRFLGPRSSGEAWVARHDDLGKHVFKFCFERPRLHALQREITLLHLLKAELGDRSDIAPILDWSFDEAPYYIESEYSEDGNLAQWSSRLGGLGRVPLESRLELTAQIAEALAAAHSVGVLHKDINPTNVLIWHQSPGSPESGPQEVGPEEAGSSGSGTQGSGTQGSGGREPKARLTDFGVGDVVDDGRLADLPQAGLSTDLSSLIKAGPSHSPTLSSPLYLAPELLEGKLATLQSDVYALGVLLFQMVIGDLTRALAPGWEREIEDPLLVEDIALAVDGAPERRLRDAHELARRLRKLEARRALRAVRAAELDGARRQRIEAQKDKIELARQRRRRNTAVLAAAILLLFGLSLGVQSWRVAREAQRAEVEAQTSERVSEFLIELFDSPRPDLALGNDVAAREVLDRGARRIETELEMEPALQARLMNVMGRVYHGLGLYKEARDLLEKSLSLRRDMYGDGHPETVVALGQLGRTLAMAEQAPRSVRLLEEALESQRLLASDPVAEIRILNDLAFSLAMTGDLADSEARCLEALEIAEPLGDRAETVRTLTGLSQVLTGEGELDRALELSQRAEAMSRRLFGDDHPRTATVLNNLTGLYLALGDLDAAERSAVETLDMQKRVLGEDHLHLAWAYTSLGRVLQRQGDLEAAEAEYRQALRLFEAHARPGSPLLGRTYNSLASILIERGQPEEAEQIARTVISRRLEAGIVETNWRQAQTLGVLGEALMAQGRFEEAEAELLRAEEATERSAGAGAPYLQQLRESLEALYEDWDRPDPSAESGRSESRPAEPMAPD